ncbi:FAD/NAD(P)-binding protein [Brevibacterium spongiae]|uniref:FAD/NAD(P)-binding protein n=1 Tax=Brevibacterium spongiae TaxID=2909672 RepID=A0ABY5SMX7_9MICO|nr:FAD/NAD(P)-binding protein [Brevibacterium spongiae]UVI35650.1 FAD/NAD(P)-binding protein [Brevibacterium spongiae]
MNEPERTHAPAVAIIGVGPRGLTILERLVALAAKRFAGSSAEPGTTEPDGTAEPALTIHLIDPYPMGAGIVWRTDQPESLLMNTTIAEQTVFPDASCTFLGPDEEPPGPSMAEWYVAGGGTEPLDSTFPSRALYGRYLRDAYTRIRSNAPACVEIVEHPTKAESVIDLPTLDESDVDTPVPEQLVRCQNGTTIIATAVVLAVGHIPSAQPEERARLAAFAELSNGLYLPQGLPAETPVAEVAPGDRVIVRGMGLNYFDLQTLFTHERGGEYLPQQNGELRYRPSGREPLLALGSRRGIPYRSKPICRDHPRRDWPLRYFTRENVALLAGLDSLEGDGFAEARFNDQLWPLILADLRLAYYHTLSQVRPDAFAGDPGQLREAIAEAVSRHLTRRTWQETHPQAAGRATTQSTSTSRTVPSPRTAASATATDDAARQGRVTREAFAWSEIEEALVPDPTDRMSLHSLLNPLEGELFVSREPGEPGSLHEWMLDFLHTDLHSSLAGPTGHPEKALFPVLWQSRLLLKELIVAGHIDRVSIDMEILGWFEGFVSGICDGPPPQRIAELLALAEAGIVTFIGPDMRIEENTTALADEASDVTGSTVASSDATASTAASTAVARSPRPHPEIFKVTSAQAAGEITGGVVIDAASPTNSVARAADVLLYGMLERGQLTAARLTLDDGREKFLNGLALTPRPYRTIDVEGQAHPRRFALSIQLSSKQWGLAIAANPGVNAATLNDSHAAAEAILDLL